MTEEERKQAYEWFANRNVPMPGARRMYRLAAEALASYQCEKEIIKEVKGLVKGDDGDGSYSRE